MGKAVHHKLPLIILYNIAQTGCWYLFYTYGKEEKSFAREQLSDPSHAIVQTATACPRVKLALGP